MRQFDAGILLVFAACVAFPSAAVASVRDAALTGLSCRTCHVTTAELTDIGNAYRAPSNRLAPIGQRPVAALKATGAYVSDGNGAGLPKAINDYLTLMFAGKISRTISFAAEQRIVDGGQIAGTREAYLDYHRTRFRALIGADTLPLQISPDRYRDLHTNYLIDDQTLGANPFTLGVTHPQIALYVGDPFRGFEGGALVLGGHEVQSGVPQRSYDTAFSFKLRRPGLTVAVLTYAGGRPTGQSGTTDRFVRTLASMTMFRGPWTFETQLGNAREGDAGDGTRATGSGGIAQLRYDLRPGAFLETRYEGISDTRGSFVRQTVLGGGVRLGSSLRLTIEDALASSPRHHVLHVVLGAGASTARIATAAY